jgi:aryl-alcohol dehydrogenase-like predicted oxidoreductase
MIYTTLGNTDVKVSKICLGTMTWGEQNTEADGHEQMDYAFEKGINFFDTAEMYSVPAKPETYGRTEEIIGTWLKKTGNRDKIVLATKAAGPGPIAQHVRNNPNFSKAQLIQAVDASLKRLQTDYIDLYQLHWPERPTNFFGSLSYKHQSDDIGTDFKEILEGLQALIQAGKIRQVGISNETPWGLAHYLHLSKMYGLPKMQSIQNPYSLLNRTFEVGLAEMAIREKTGLLAYSPLGFGVLSGKYLHSQPAKARITLYPRFSRYSNPLAIAATQKYVDLARSEGLKPAQMALAFVNTRPFVTSNIIGATTMEQLKENIGSIDLSLNDALLEKIEAIHQEGPNPSP